MLIKGYYIHYFQFSRSFYFNTVYLQTGKFLDKKQSACVNELTVSISEWNTKFMCNTGLANNYFSLINGLKELIPTGLPY